MEKDEKLRPGEEGEGRNRKGRERKKGKGHYHHQVARSENIADSTTRRQEERSAVRRNAEWRPRLDGLRSRSIV